MKVIKALIASVLILALDFGISWLAMLWLGIAHHQDDRIPAFGYWTTFFLMWAMCAPVESVMAGRAIREALNDE